MLIVPSARRGARPRLFVEPAPPAMGDQPVYRFPRRRRTAPIPPVLTDRERQCERIGAAMRSAVNFKLLVDDLEAHSPVAEAYGDAADRLGRLTSYLSFAAFDYFDLTTGGGGDERQGVGYDMKLRIAAAMELPRDTFERDLDTVCAASGLSWDLDFLQQRHPGVGAERILERIAQLRSAHVVICDWDPEEDMPPWESGRAELRETSTWLAAENVSRTLAERLAVQRCLETGEVVVLDSHVHAWPLPSDYEGTRRAAFIADAAQLIVCDATARIQGALRGRLPTAEPDHAHMEFV